MLTLFKPNQHSILGVDINSTSVKIIEISANETTHLVEEYNSAMVPANSVEGHTIKDSNAVAHCIKQLLAQSKFISKSAVIAIPDAAVINKIVQINDGLTDAEIEEVIMMGADKYIPYPIDEINFDFEVIGFNEKNKALLDVMVVATRAINVSNRVETLAKAGLNVAIVDVESFAIERVSKLFVQALPAQGMEQIIAVIIIDTSFARLFVLDGMKIIFTREEDFGGKQLIDAIAAHYQVTYSEALHLSMQNKMPDDYQQQVLTPFVETLLQHVKRTLQFFFTTTHHSAVDHIFLTGSVAKIVNLAQLIQEKIKISTQVIDLFDYIPRSKKIETTLITSDESPLVACGLALRNQGLRNDPY